MISRTSLSGSYPIVRLDHAVDFLDSKRRPVTESERRAGPFPYYGANGIQGTIDNFIFDEPLVLLAEDGGHFNEPDRGIAYRISGKTWVNNHAHVLKPKHIIDLAYLCRVLENYDVSPFVSGTTRGKLTKAGASEIMIPLPPLPEQRRIAEVLDRVEGLRAKRRESIVNIELLAQGIFRELFGDPVQNPMKWKLTQFGDVCETRLGKMLDQKQQNGKNPRPYLRNANVQWFRFDLQEVFEMDFDQKARVTHLLRKGDLLICEGGDPGRCAIWNEEIVECYFQKALHRARPNKAVCNAEYLSWLLWFLSKGGGLGDYVTSATIAHLTGEKLKGMPIPLPPIKLQQEFARRIAAVEKLKSAHRASLAQLDALFASLQHRAFRGEL